MSPVTDALSVVTGDVQGVPNGFIVSAVTPGRNNHMTGVVDGSRPTSPEPRTPPLSRPPVPHLTLAIPISPIAHPVLESFTYGHRLSIILG